MNETETSYQQNVEALQYRCARPEDGIAVWKLVQASGTLEANTAYFYLIFCSDFAQTCLIAEYEGKPVGVIVGYHPPKETDTAFCWQIGVHPDWRGLGVASRLLMQWLQLPANRAVRYVTATVATDNEPSDRLFRSLARRLNVNCDVKPHFTESLLEPGHAPEPLYRIGPVDRSREQDAEESMQSARVRV
ncbi:diaminobutyrate acetyltransferase [Orrella marina]|uniref:L-2,4-diaminobutyric acid acetyltransferase n=1 Tax=Orrella marina TaxID=2163011 RepID=A0A2R4XPG9_9BURK|nr:diaminobutyrate acetyltransferase [Orrella marina]AWB35690.1 diaminobutyrate acetyltransferase [Orrella marina]